MSQMVASDEPSKPRLRIFGANETHLWGMTSAERITRIANKAGLELAAGGADGPVLLINSDYAFDSQWLGFVRARPERVLTVGGVPIMALTSDAQVAAAICSGRPSQLDTVRAEDHREFYNSNLRKREEPFIERLSPVNAPRLERLSYYGAYKGVTDLLTKYLWPELAFHLTRLAARLGISPNMVTALGAVGCVLATVAFWYGHYWSGIAVGFVFMVFDTVDGKLARCTITSSKWGDIFDHGIDLVHPLFWWWAWAHGLDAWGLALGYHDFVLVMGVMVAGYVIQRLIEGAFIQRFMMHIHVWRRFDSRFRLVTARRNPNMVILFVALLFARPDLGIIGVAWWTAISCAVHAVRLVQAELARRRRGVLTSWLEEPA